MTTAVEYRGAVLDSEHVGDILRRHAEGLRFHQRVE